MRDSLRSPRGVAFGALVLALSACVNRPPNSDCLTVRECCRAVSLRHGTPWPGVAISACREDGASTNINTESCQSRLATLRESLGPGAPAECFR